MTQHWKSALVGVAAVIFFATAGAGTASAHELPGMAKTAASAPADGQGDCVAHLSIKGGHHSSLYEISYGGSSHGWAPPGFLRITAVLVVNGDSEGSVSGTVTSGRSVDTPTGTDFSRSMRYAMVSVRADGPGGSVSCQQAGR